MIRAGWSPSVRLFEATACGTPVVSDEWQGIEAVFQPGTELLILRDTEDAVAALAMPDHRRAAIGAAGRTRTLRHHTGIQRAIELERHLQALTRS